MKPEEKARLQIDHLLEAAGWQVQDLRNLNLGASLGVAVREFPLKTGEADYLLFVDRNAVGVIEAKPEGTTLSGVADQTVKYIAGSPQNLPHVQEPLPFTYESTGTETFFMDLQIIYSKPYGKRHLTYEAIKELADAIKKPPYQLTPDRLWQAYEQLEKSKVKRAGPQKLLTDIVSLVRFALGKDEVLAPFYEKGGAIKAYQVFGQELDRVLEELSEALVA